MHKRYHTIEWATCERDRRGYSGLFAAPGGVRNAGGTLRSGFSYQNWYNTLGLL